jgi:sec-independent protein translocase protein TatA
MNGLKPWHIFVVLIVLVVLFGAKRLPDAARSLGRSMRILKDETRAMHEDNAAQGGTDTPPRPLEPRPLESRPVDGRSLDGQQTPVVDPVHRVRDN